MKKILLAGIGIILLALYSCQPMMSLPDTKPENITINFALASDFSVFDPTAVSASVQRTLTPGSNGPPSVTFAKYHLDILLGEVNKYSADVTLTGSKINQTITIDGYSSSATYTAKVTAYSDDAKTMPVAEGETDFTAISNAGPVSIVLKPIVPVIDSFPASPRKGYFSYSLNAPEDFDGTVSLRGPRLSSAIAFSGDEILENNSGEVFPTANYAGLAGVPKGTSTKDSGQITLNEGLYDFSYKLGTATVVSEVVYIYPGLETKYINIGWSTSDVNGGTKQYLTGTLSIINADNFDLKDITIKAFQYNAGSATPLTLQTTALGSATATIQQGTDYNNTPPASENITGRAKFTGGYTGANSGMANGDTVTVQWGMSLNAIAGSYLTFKAFSSATAAGSPTGSPDIFLASDILGANSDLLKVDVSAATGQRTGIILNDRAVGPPSLLSAIVYDAKPNELVLAFNQPVNMEGSAAGWSLEGMSFIEINDDVYAVAVDTPDATGCAYIWKLKLNASVVKDQTLELGYESDAGTVKNAYSVKLKDISPFDDWINSVGNPTAAPPNLVTAYVNSSVTKWTSSNLNDARIADEITLVFDQPVRMPNNVTANNSGWTLTSNAVSPAPAGFLGNKSRTSAVDSAERTVQPETGSAFAAVEPYYYNDAGTKVSTDGTDTTASNVWVLPLATAKDGGRYTNYFFISGDTATLSYTEKSPAITTTGVGNTTLKTTSRPVTNNVPAGDWTPPQIFANGGAFVSNDEKNILQVSFTEPVTISVSNNIAANSGFSLSGGGTPNYVTGNETGLKTANASIAQSGIAIPSALWRLGLNTPIVYGNTATLTYSDTATSVYDAAGNYLVYNKLDGGSASISVENRSDAPPKILSAVIANDLDPAIMTTIQTASSNTAITPQQVIALYFDKAVTIPTGNNAAVSAFGVTVSGSSRSGKPTAINKAVSASGTYNNLWYLVMNNPAVYADSTNIKLSYNPPGDTSDVRTEADIKNALLKVENYPVTNNAISDSKPKILSANLNKNSGGSMVLLTLVFSEPVLFGEANWDASVFSIYQSNPDSPIISGGTIQASELKFAIPYTSSEPVMTVTLQTDNLLSAYTNSVLNVRYKAGTGSKFIKDLTGNKMADSTKSIQNFLSGDFISPNIVSASVGIKTEQSPTGVFTLVFDEPVTIPFTKDGNSVYTLQGYTFKVGTTEHRFKNLDSNPASGVSDGGGSSRSNIWTADIVTIAGGAYTPGITDTFSIAYSRTTGDSLDAFNNELNEYAANQITVQNTLSKNLFLNFPASSIPKGFSITGQVTGTLAGSAVQWSIAKGGSPGLSNNTGFSIGGTKTASGSIATVYAASDEPNTSIIVTVTADGVSASQTLIVTGQDLNSSVVDTTLSMLYAYEPTSAESPLAAGITAAKNGTKIAFSPALQNYIVLTSKDTLWFAVSSASSMMNLSATVDDLAAGTSSPLAVQGQSGYVYFFTVPVPSPGYKQLSIKVTSSADAGTSRIYQVTIGKSGGTTTEPTVSVTNSSGYAVASSGKMHLIARNKEGYTMASASLTGSGPYSFTLSIPSGQLYDYYATWTSGGVVYASRAARAKGTIDNNSAADDYKTNFTYSSATSMSLTLTDDAVGRVITSPTDLLATDGLDGNFVLAGNLDFDVFGPFPLVADDANTIIRGAINSFSGNLFGNRNKINYSLKNFTRAFVGFFGTILSDANGARIYDLQMTIPDSIQTNGGSARIGILANTLSSSGSYPVLIENVKVSGTVQLNKQLKWEDTYIGGIAAQTSNVAGGSITIRNCSSSVVINENSSADNTQHVVFGGILGVAYNTTVVIENCYWDGSISMKFVGMGNSGKYAIPAGIVGWGYTANLTISNCYSAGTISLDSSSTSVTQGITMGGIFGFNNGATVNIDKCVVLNPSMTVNTKVSSTLAINRISAHSVTISNCYALPVGTGSDKLNISYNQAGTTGKTSTAITGGGDADGEGSASDLNGMTKAKSNMTKTWWTTTMGFTEEDGWDYGTATGTTACVPVLR